MLRNPEPRGQLYLRHTGLVLDRSLARVTASPVMLQLNFVFVLCFIVFFFFCSWDNLHLRQRRSPHHVHLAAQRPAEHAGRPAGSGLQHAAEGGRSSQGGECERTGRLSGAAHSKIALHLLMKSLVTDVSATKWRGQGKDD